VNTFLSTQQKALQDKYQTFANEEIAPFTKELETCSFDLKKLFEKIGQLGYLKYTTLLDVTLFVETISQYDSGLALTVSQHIALIEVIKKYGTENQKAAYLPLLEEAKVIGTLAFSEKNAGVDYQAVETSAETTGDNYVLNGEKTWVVNGALSNLFLVLAKSGQGLSLLLVDKREGNSSTLNIGPNIAKLGLSSAYTNDIVFSNVKTSSQNKIANKEPVQNIALYALDVAKVILAAGSIGMLANALNIALEHARQRKQFGQNIGQFQGIQWKIADFGTELEGAKLQVYRAAWSHDHDSGSFFTYSAMAKLSATKAARIYTGESIQILGAKGISLDTPLERFYRDAKVMEICLGTSEFQKILLTEALAIAK
jgi:alkylation response protein AidB-like acyl-CoA dehydrogenase